MHLKEIRKNYDKNYQEMLEIISKMGGDDKIRIHRQKKTALYKRLKELQKREDYLNTLENRILYQHSNVRA
ncbi:MAG: hypothetical protein Kow0042_22500 [Calditrichia bacterium]